MTPLRWQVAQLAAAVVGLSVLAATLVALFVIDRGAPGSLEDVVPIVARAFEWPEACCFVQKNGVVCRNDFPVAERVATRRDGKTCKAATERGFE